MKKILFTGGTGFLGRNLIPLLSKKYHIFAPGRKELNLTDIKTLESYNIKALNEEITQLIKERLELWDK